MNLRATSTMALVLALGFSGTAWAQDVGLEEPSAEPEDRLEGPPPTAGALPYEDPTSQPDDVEDLQKLGAPEDGSPDAEADSETAEVDGAQTTGSLPVEDPMLHAPAEPEARRGQDGTHRGARAGGQQRRLERQGLLRI